MTQQSDRELPAQTSQSARDWTASSSSSTRPAKPQALGQVLEMMGFRPIARHRSREVLLYRQGDMNVIVNAHAGGQARAVRPAETPVIAAIALRVRDAAAAYRHAIERGAWVVPSNVEVMELNIPAIHGVGVEPHLLRRPLSRFLDLRRRLHAESRRRRAPAGADRPALVRHRPVHRQRPHGRLDRVLRRALRLPRPARRKALRHPAQGPHPGEPVRQLLPAADRADARHLRGGADGDAAARRPGHARRARHRRGADGSAASNSSSRRACTPRRAAR